MCDREHRNVIPEPDEHDVVRKVVDGEASDILVGDTGNERSCIGKLLQMTERLPNLRGKALGYVGAPFPIPGSCFTQFAPCSFAEANRPHRASTSR